MDSYSQNGTMVEPARRLRDYQTPAAGGPAFFFIPQPSDSAVNDAIRHPCLCLLQPYFFGSTV